MKLSTKIIAGFLTIMLLFVVLMGINKLFSRYVEEDMRWVSHSEEVLRLSSDMQKLVERMQSGLRGYMLAEDEDFLQGYYEATSQFEDLYNKKSDLVRPYSVQWDRFQQIREIEIQYKNDYADLLIAAKRDALADTAKARVYNQLFEQTFKKKYGKQLLDRLRKLFTDFDEAEYLQRQQRRRDLTLSLYRIDTISLILAGFILLVAVAVMIVVTTHISKRINSMISVAETIAHGNFNIQVKDGTKDEMNRLAQSLNRMTRAIQESFNKLEQANKELELTNRDLENFAYVASHDLKEPVRMISNYTQLLSSRYSEKLDDEAREFISYAVDGSHRIRSLINDLLNYVQLTQSQLHMAQVDMNTVLVQAVAQMKECIDSTEAQIEIEPMPEVRADHEKMVLLFCHLLDNAIKFCKAAEKPLVHIQVRPELSRWVFSVNDNGIGMDAQYQEKIFTIFQRLHRKEEYTGTGIGLTLCKKIVELHGGNIWVESEPGKGTTIFFTLPIA